MTRIAILFVFLATFAFAVSAQAQTQPGIYGPSGGGGSVTIGSTVCSGTCGASSGSPITGLFTSGLTDTSGITSNGNTSVVGGSFGLSGNITASGIFGTNGVRYKNVAATLSDTTSSGTIANNYDNVWGGSTLTATSATTLTNEYGAYFKAPTCSTNVTCTTKSALGADSISIAIGSAAAPSLTFGSGQLDGFFSPGSGQLSWETGGTPKINFIASQLRFTSDSSIRFVSSTDFSGSTDATFTRAGAGVLQIGTTANNALGSLLLTNLTATGTINLGLYTVSSGTGHPALPSASTAGAGAQAYVTDAVACTFLATVTGGGSTGCPVISNGTNWQGA